jgi:hypothetical protein
MKELLSIARAFVRVTGEAAIGKTAGEFTIKSNANATLLSILNSIFVWAVLHKEFVGPKSDKLLARGPVGPSVSNMLESP